MRVLLYNVNPNQLSDICPIGVLSIATYLENKGHNVRVIDGVSSEKFPFTLRNFDPDVVGISFLTAFADSAYDAVVTSKKLGYYTVVGGAHPTSLPEEAITVADAVVLGEGEKALEELLTTKKKGIIKGEPIDLNELGMLDYSKLNMEYYANIRRSTELSIWSFVLPFDRSASMFATRGCPFRCTFCHNSISKELPIRYRSVDLVIEEIKMLKDKYKINALHFVDDNFIMKKAYTESLCERLQEEKLGMYFSCSARAPNINDDILDVLKSGGCSQIAFGFESPVQRMLDLYNKQFTVDDIENAIALCNKHEIAIQGSFIIGGPTETLDEITQTYRYIKSHKITSSIGAFIATPYPSTEMWDWADRNGRLKSLKSWGDLSYHKSGGCILHNTNHNIVVSLVSELNSYALNELVKHEKERFKWSRETKKAMEK